MSPDAAIRVQRKMGEQLEGKVKYRRKLSRKTKVHYYSVRKLGENKFQPETRTTWISL